VDCVEARNACNAGSEQLRATIEKILPFVYLVQRMPVPDTRRRALTTPHWDFELAYVGPADRVEVVVSQSRAPIAKFFLARSSAGLDLQRFRIAGKDSVQLSFVAGATAATD
jgi:hypothetical protein